ncbi:conserved oligomeric Golgi complex subunit 5 [Diabrotica virgifera virgifera]|uniref:Conserved oligomeric Golgi complex subunit 5 n=1 Tax=Diabrotica virgifera virgifera TaxID=50390 RepID=A0A6P7GL52_DIAVI|nr:conserved oligomeric Golgi complex subunit 5 [Diabrotica virgifera virgifera]
MGDTKNELIGRIETEEFYVNFLNPNSDNILNESIGIKEQVKKLAEGIELINQELHRQILEKHEDLLQQANNATKLETVLNSMNSHVKTLFIDAERLKTQITIPYNELEKHTKVLGRLHLASHILRQVNRLQQLSKRLTNTNDPVQKAILLQELEQLASDPELKDIDSVKNELRNIRVHQQKVVQLATGSLNQGAKNENITQTTTALQIFINIGTIESVANSFVDNNLHECRESLKLALSVSSFASSKTKGGPGHINITSSQGFRTKVWSEIEKVFAEDIFSICKQVKFLHNTLSNLYLVHSDLNIAEKFWIGFGKVFQEEIQKSTLALKQTLEEDFPKLLKCYYEMTNKLKYDLFAFDRSILKNLENAYLSISLTRMLDPTQAMFTGENTLPSQDQIDSLIRIITSELSVALIEENLSEQIGKNVSKCIKMFAVKTEQQLETGPEAAQVIGGTPNMGQQKNVNLANSLYYFQLQTQRMLSNMKDSLTDPCKNIITDSLQSLHNLVAAILQPLAVSINSVIETIIVTLHLEADWTKVQIPHKISSSCSLYMKELNQFISRVYQTYLDGFKNKEVLASKCNEIAVRTIELFIRHVSLLRPLAKGGRVRLQADFQHLENALKIICPHLADLGRPYRLLKSVASVIVLSPEEIVAGQTPDSSIPHSTILLMLFAFAGLDLASPHQNTSWSLPKISAWLDEHQDEGERLDLIAGALQKYESLVRQKNSTNYDPLYPILSQYLERALKEI